MDPLAEGSPGEEQHGGSGNRENNTTSESTVNDVSAYNAATDSFLHLVTVIMIHW